ncbi:hypothetical protein U1Q18_048383 [Sarracenia purpurea var. burkii]
MPLEAPKCLILHTPESDDNCVLSHEIVPWESSPESDDNRVFFPLEGGIRRDIEFNVPEVHARWGPVKNEDNRWK